jgi:hypothetical protein
LEAQRGVSMIQFVLFSSLAVLLATRLSFI